MKIIATLLSLWMLVSCGGGGSAGGGIALSYSVGGSITGLGSAAGLSLVNGAETLPIAANATTFMFGTQLAQGANYGVTVGAQPTGSTCGVTTGTGTGTIANANVNTVAIVCTRRSATGPMVSTLAGDDGKRFVDGTGAAVRFNSPASVALDSAGNMYVADSGNHAIRKVSPSGAVTTLAGNGTSGLADGIGSAARFNFPAGVAVDSTGNVYVADRWNHAIRKISPSGAVTTLAGNGTSGLADGIGSAARFNFPAGVAVDNAGNVYVADSENHAIRKISPSGAVTTLAGNGTSGLADGIGSAARFSYPVGVAIDGAGNVYVADRGNLMIRRISPAGEVATLAGGTYGFADGVGTAARFRGPSGVALDSAGNVYVADAFNSAIRKVSPAGEVTTLAGGTYGFTDGVGTAARFGSPDGVAVDSAGNVYVADSYGRAIRKIAPSGAVTTLAGNGPVHAFIDGSGILARFSDPYGVAVDSVGNVYVADVGNDAIRKISPSGEVATLAGNGSAGFVDGIGAAARFRVPSGVAVDSAGNVYVADAFNSAIRRISPSGEVTTLAGDGIGGVEDGVGATARFWSPYGVAVDSAGNVYVADLGSSRIRKITPSGVVSTLAGNGTSGLADGIGAAARFAHPSGVAVDLAGDVYVADSKNHAIRKVSPSGVVTTVAGNGSAGFVDGIGAAARFDNPSGVAVDTVGNVYVADLGNNAIRKISPSGMVTTLAGNHGPGLFVDGSGDVARFDRPYGVAVDSAGNLYIADLGNSAIRKIVP